MLTSLNSIYSPFVDKAMTYSIKIMNQYGMLDVMLFFPVFHLKDSVAFQTLYFFVILIPYVRRERPNLSLTPAAAFVENSQVTVKNELFFQHRTGLQLGTRGSVPGSRDPVSF